MMASAQPYRSGVDLLVAVEAVVDPLIQAARRQHVGVIPIVGDPEWWSAPDDVRLASVLLVAKAFLLGEQLRAADGVKGASVALSTAGINWASNYAEYVELARSRAERITPIRCSHPGCREVVSVQHPLPPDLGTVRCHRHTNPTEAAA